MDPIDATVSRAHNAQRDGFEGNIESDLLSDALKERGAQVSPRDNINNNPERDYLAGAVYSEAGSEGPRAMGYVGNVVKNRVESPQYPDTFQGVFTQDGQFSPYNSTSGYAGGEQGNDSWKRPSAEAYRVADQVMSGALPDATGGALNFYNPNISQPAWGGSSFAQLPGTQHVFGTAGGGGGPTRAPANQVAGGLTQDQVRGLMQKAGSPDPNVSRIATAMLNRHLESIQQPSEMERLKLEAQRLNNEKLQTELARGPKREFREIVGPDGIEYLAEYDPQTNTWKPANMPQGGTPAVRPPSQSEAQRKKADEANAKLFDTLTTDGIAANRNLGRVEILEDLLGDTETGLVAEGKRIAGQWGIKTEGLDDIQATVALLNTLIPAQRPEGSGTTSDRDMDLYRASLPQLINTEGGNAIIVETMKRLGKYTVEQGKIAQLVQTNKISTEEGFNRLNDLPDPFEGFKEWRKERKAGKEAPAKAAVSGNIKAIGNMSFEALERLREEGNLSEEEEDAAYDRWEYLLKSRENSTKGGRL